MMLSTAMLLDAEPPRIARGMGEYWIPRLPFVGTAAARGGAMVGTPDNCRHMLENEECVMVFPEGVRGINKPYRKRYRLQRFGQGFMRLALEARAPIVPVGIVGSEEQQPGIANLPALGRLVGMPAFPITATFPWLGPLGLLPLPVKYRLHFGEPLAFEGDSNEEDAAIEDRVAVVRRALEELLASGRRERRGIFR
jgi:1-acyl-sn-glycerol-3-phosphate acyltransferase